VTTQHDVDLVTLTFDICQSGTAEYVCDWDGACARASDFNMCGFPVINLVMH